MRPSWIAFLSIVIFLSACGGGEPPMPTLAPSATASTVPTVEATAEVTEVIVPTETATNSPTIVPSETSTPTPTETATAIVRAQAECPAFVGQALANIRSECDPTQRNEVCYSHTNIQAAFRSDIEPIKFEDPGDIAPLSAVTGLTLNSDLANNQWGVALLRLQANLPDTLPGQNVTVLLFGGTEFSDRGAEGYYFSGGIGDAACSGAPSDGILVQSPSGAYEISLRLNGADISLGSTAFIQAQAGEAMQINVLEGRAIVQSEGVTQVVVAGEKTGIELDDAGTVSSPPSIPEPYTEEETQELPVSELERPIEIAPPSVPDVTEDIGYVRLVDSEGQSLIGVLLARPVDSENWEYGDAEGSLELPVGMWEVQAVSNPPVTQTFDIQRGQTVTFEMSATGIVQTVNPDNTLLSTYFYAIKADDWAGSTSDGTLELLPGDYTIYVSTRPETVREVTVVAGETITLPIEARGDVEILETDGTISTQYVYAQDEQDTFVTSTSDGVLVLPVGTYDIFLPTNPPTQERITVTLDDVPSVTIPQSGKVEILDASGDISDIYSYAMLTSDDSFGTSTSNGEMNLLPGEYDIYISTTPETIVSTTVVAGETVQVSYVENGTLIISSEEEGALEVSGYAARTDNDDYGGSVTDSPLTLQPGEYIIYFNTLPSVTETVTVIGGETTTVSYPLQGTIQIVDFTDEPIVDATITATRADGSYGGYGTGSITVLVGDYTLDVTIGDNTYTVEATVVAGETVDVKPSQ